MGISAVPRSAFRPHEAPLVRWLQRLNDRESKPLPAFDARRRRLLYWCTGTMLMLTAWWGGYFAFQSQLPHALTELSGTLIAIVTLSMIRRDWLRLASLTLIALCSGMIVWVSVFVDIPTPAVPRAVSLYFLPLGAFSHFMLQFESRWMRGVIIGLQMLCFIALGVTGLSFGQPEMMAEADRYIAGIVTSASAFALTWLFIHLMLSDARERSALELDFARAIAAGELQPFLQAQCDADGRIVGAEALMRWLHPRRGFISPAEFIPMAERSGLIIPAGERMIAEVCSLLERWRGDSVFGSLVVAVNVSPAQLFDDSGPSILERVPAARQAQGRLKFELTESIFVEDVEKVRAKLNEFRLEGIRIALDDFGTGFSSLSYLRQLPLDQLKVDQSFVRELPQEQSAWHIAETIIKLGKDLGMEVVAEGVETVAQRDALENMGCRCFQGWLFAKPMPADAFEELVRSRSTVLQARWPETSTEVAAVLQES
ncbi:putative bifunctional diguanylate cyclase/phosphodiesterase [Burkholderiaceae bacterium UC74_6]